MNSSLKSLSHGEEFLQNDVLQVLNNPQKVSLFNFFKFIYHRKKAPLMKIK